MTPSEHTMPIIVATELEGYGWMVKLPGDRQRQCKTKDEARTVIDSEAPGSAIRWVDAPPNGRRMSAMQQTTHVA